MIHKLGPVRLLLLLLLAVGTVILFWTVIFVSWLIVGFIKSSSPIVFRVDRCLYLFKEEIDESHTTTRPSLWTVCTSKKTHSILRRSFLFGFVFFLVVRSCHRRSIQFCCCCLFTRAAQNITSCGASLGCRNHLSHLAVLRFDCVAAAQPLILLVLEAAFEKKGCNQRSDALEINWLLCTQAAAAAAANFPHQQRDSNTVDIFHGKFFFKRLFQRRDRGGGFPKMP